MEEWIAIGVALAVLVGLYFYLSPNATQIVPTVFSGRKSLSAKAAPSTDRPAGIEFSYTGWLRIDDFTYRYGSEKVIFVKGSPDMSVACPALYIDANTNSLMVKMDTYGTQEVIPIVSVPSKKWLHFAIVATQDKLEVYINGIIYAHHTLVNVPKLNTGSVVTSPNGGFKGEVSKIEYQPRALSTSEILALAKQNPPTSESGQVFPPYFSSRWFNQ